MKRREDLPTLTCRGCGHQMEGTEVTRLGNGFPDGERKAFINWTCENRRCDYGPRPIPDGDHLDD